MKAVVIHQFGGLDRVRVEEMPEPKALRDEVVIQVKSCGLNHLDIWVRNGRPGSNLKMPHILGSDASGIVAAVGADVSEVRTGDQVILNPGLSCGHCEHCRRGQNSECDSFGIIGLNRPGTFAELVAVAARNIYPKPAFMSFDEAGAFVLCFLTAWRMLVTKANLKSGQTVLIHGIGGGVALSALQLARLMAAEVIVTSSSDEKLSQAKKIGADHIINYKTTGDIAKSVRQITSGRGVDIIIDTVGAATFPIDLSAARKGGVIVLCGVTSGAAAQANLQAIYWNQLKVLGSTLGSDEDLRQMLRAVETAKIKTVIDSVKPLADAREAMSRMESAEQFGKVVLKVKD
jgi:NADPH:quinone reductase-like Zn-dependent oxidoreductase